jgi:predicted dehydrogenase
MTKPFNIAIIGYGGFGRFLHDTWSILDEVAITMVVDVDASRLPSRSGLRTSTHWQDLLTDPSIDGVAIVTAPSTHAEIAVACMEVGKHVFIEKPIALTMDDYDRILEARDRTGMSASIDHIMRFNPLLTTLKSVVDSGALGKLRRADIENYAQDETMDASHWFWNIDVSGGILLEHAVHFIDLIHYLQPSEVTGVTGMRQVRKNGLEDQVMANVTYADGLVATHYHSFARPTYFERTSIKLSFDLADIDLFGWVPLQGRIHATISSEGLQSMEQLPGFKLTNTYPFTPRKVHSAGLPYEVSVHLDAEFGLSESKDEVYRSCVRDSLLNLVRHSRTPDAEVLNAPLDIGRSCLHIGLAANSMARSLPTALPSQP